MEKLLEYTIEKMVDQEDGSTTLTLAILGQQYMARAGSDELMFTSSTGFVISSILSYLEIFMYRAICREVRLAANGTIRLSHATAFDTEEECDEYVSHFQHALDEWVEWGGFHELQSGAFMEALPVNPPVYGLNELFAGHMNTLERQLARF